MQILVTTGLEWPIKWCNKNGGIWHWTYNIFYSQINAVTPGHTATTPATSTNNSTPWPGLVNIEPVRSKLPKDYRPVKRAITRRKSVYNSKLKAVAVVTTRRWRWWYDVWWRIHNHFTSITCTLGFDLAIRKDWHGKTGKAGNLTWAWMIFSAHRFQIIFRNKYLLHTNQWKKKGSADTRLKLQLPFW